MQELAEKLPRQVGWGASLSAGVHVLLILLLVFGLPMPSPSPAPKEVVNIELVPPPKPEPKPQTSAAKSDAPPPKPRDRSRPVMAFESSAAKSEQEVKEPQPAPEAPTVAPEASAPKVPTAPDTQASAAQQPDTPPGAPERESPDGVAPAAPKAEQTAAAATAPANPVPTPAAKPQPQESKKADTTKPTSPRQSNKLVAARELFTPNAIFDPRVLQAIGRLTPQQRIKQLCMVEAIAQVRKQRPAVDILIPYGSSGGNFSDYGLDGRGGAFRDGINWYNIDIRCKVDADRTKVAAFSFAVGSMVPRSEWARREFPAD